MTRRSSRSSRRVSRRLLETRAPKPATLVIAAALYVAGLFGYLDWYPLSDALSVGLLALAGGLLLLGALLRDL